MYLKLITAIGSVLLSSCAGYDHSFSAEYNGLKMDYKIHKVSGKQPVEVQK